MSEPDRDSAQHFVDFKGDIISPPADSVITSRTGVFALCICQGAVLLIKEKDYDQRWELPGGGVDPGEDFQTALRREIYEESGLDIPLNIKADQPDYYQKVNFYACDLGEFWNYDQYYFRLADSMLRAHVFEGVKTSPEGGKTQWLSLSQIRNLGMILWET
ncbi:MAG: NUDIX domain-containing protein, partial [Pseudomonadota bacterium]